MKSKKIYTVPGGVALVAVSGGMTLLPLALGLVLCPDPVGFLLFVLSLLFLGGTLALLHRRHLNGIHVTETAVRHGATTYGWDRVCITMKQSRPDFFRNSYDCIFFFSDRYLTAAEAGSPAVRKQGFYILLTRRRMEALLPLYHKKIAILDEALVEGNRALYELAEAHNRQIDAP